MAIPSNFVPTGATRAYIAQKEFYKAQDAMQRNLVKVVTKNIVTGAKGHQIKELEKIFSRKNLQKDIARAHGSVAESMAKAVQAKVSEISGASRSTSRPGRLSGGLARAVAAPEFAMGDQLGIHFIDRESMAKEAAHWQRLNFGTGSLQEQAMIAKPRFDGRQLLDVTVRPVAFGGGRGLDTPLMPEGYFKHDKGGWTPRKSEFSRTGNPFSVKSPAGDFLPTADIRPRHFINHGLEAFRVNLPKVYGDLVSQFGKKGRGGRTTVRA